MKELRRTEKKKLIGAQGFAVAYEAGLLRYFRERSEDPGGMIDS